MARTTSPYVGAKAADRCHDCYNRAEATADNGNITIRVCLSHTLAYQNIAGVTVTPDAAARVALCARCRTFVGHNGRAAHRCV